MDTYHKQTCFKSLLTQVTQITFIQMHSSNIIIILQSDKLKIIFALTMNIIPHQICRFHWLYSGLGSHLGISISELKKIT